MEGVRKAYVDRVNQDIAGEGIYDKLSKIRRLQNLFKPGGLPVYLLGKRDISMYRGVMVGTVAGLGITFGTIFLMATNNLSKKSNN
ncbi:hypothetical protein AC249_AIPGENE2292 [Exaiptasia diaphana]|nr:hypothetical protein AC249_AIPGENE2292 [Exaiptasia diaphana]